jgi:hypothetical protein
VTVNVSAGITIEFGGGPTKVDFSFSVGGDRPLTPDDIVLAAVRREGANLLGQLMQPEIDDLKRNIYQRVQDWSGDDDVE